MKKLYQICLILLQDVTLSPSRRVEEGCKQLNCSKEEFLREYFKLRSILSEKLKAASRAERQRFIVKFPPNMGLSLEESLV